MDPVTPDSVSWIKQPTVISILAVLLLQIITFAFVTGMQVEKLDTINLRVERIERVLDSTRSIQEVSQRLPER